MRKILIKLITVLSIALLSLGAFAACTAPEKSVEPAAATAKYVRVNENGEEAEDGGYILFGEYPQTVKAADVEITETVDIRGYYLGSDGAYYAKITANHFIDTSADSYENIYKFTNGETVVNGEVYYFKVEPIKWRILSETEESALILCETIIDSHIFDDEVNNYKESEIRNYLNDTFYNAAFTAFEREIIHASTVDNSAVSCNPNGKPMQINHGINANACEDTEDYIFLLSEKEITTESYGFNADSNNHQAIRKKTPTDYARSTGAYIGRRSENMNLGVWWLRTPYYYGTNYAYSVNYYGLTTQTALVTATSCGIVPAAVISL